MLEKGEAIARPAGAMAGGARAADQQLTGLDIHELAKLAGLLPEPNERVSQLADVGQPELEEWRAPACGADQSA